MSRPLSYIGVSGVTTRAEAEAALAAFPDCGRQFMTGLLASGKTIAGQRNRWWRRYPPVERIAGIFLDDTRCLNLVHYASDEPPDADTLLRLFWLAGPLCHGFQFNGAWPRVGDLARLLRAFDGADRVPRIVMQARPNAVAGERDAAELSAKLWIYEGMFSDVLIDASGGAGLALDPERAAVLVQRVRSDHPLVGVGVAGGLCAETLSSIRRFLTDGCSIDAEGRLRDDADAGGNLVMDRVSAYLAAAAKVIRDACEHDDGCANRKRCSLCGQVFVRCDGCSTVAAVYHDPPACQARGASQ